jgi:hypothetical protein
LKKQNNILSVLFFITIYCFGIGFSIQKTTFSYKFTEIGKKHKKQISSLSNALYFHTPATETTFSEITEYSIPNFNQNLDSFWVIMFSSELRFYAIFRQYKTYLKTILVRYRKSDLIFPFHNFW